MMELRKHPHWSHGDPNAWQVGAQETSHTFRLSQHQRQKNLTAYPITNEETPLRADHGSVPPSAKHIIELTQLLK